jgi:ABC-type antimicrobial peptide transport system permease subunit
VNNSLFGIVIVIAGIWLYIDRKNLRLKIEKLPDTTEPKKDTRITEDLKKKGIITNDAVATHVSDFVSELQEIKESVKKYEAIDIADYFTKKES